MSGPTTRQVPPHRLHKAVKESNMKEVKRLLSLPQPQVNKRSAGANNHTALMVAAQHHTDPSITQVLLQHGADPGLPDDVDLMTSIMMACFHSDSHVAVLEAMLTHVGEDINLEWRDRESRTAVAVAVYHNSPACLRLLLEAGAKCNVASRDRKSVHLVAREMGHTEVANILKEFTKGESFC